MATLYHLEMDGVKGESVKDGHKDQIEVESFSWGITNQKSASAVGGKSGGVSVPHDFTVTKTVDKSSAKFLDSVVTGKHFPTVNVYLSRVGSGKKAEDYLTIKFTEVMITGYHLGGSPGADTGSESISFTYSTMNFDYKQQKADGSHVGAGTSNFDWSQGKQS